MGMDENLGPQFKTLYRGEGSHETPPYYPKSGPDAALAGAWWTDDPDRATNYARSAKGRVYSIEVGEHEAEPRGMRGNYVIMDPAVRARRTLHDPEPKVTRR